MSDWSTLYVLTGTKILTVFAPVDSAFTEADMKRFEENRAQARSLVLRHVTTGTLYSAGMQYYQQRESLDKGRQLTVLKEAGEYRKEAGAALVLIVLWAEELACKSIS